MQMTGDLCSKVKITNICPPPPALKIRLKWWLYVLCKCKYSVIYYARSIIIKIFIMLSIGLCSLFEP